MIAMAASSDSIFLQYGAVGLLALMAAAAAKVLFGQNSAFTARETQRADRNEEALKELNKAVQERVIPAALEMISTTKQLIELMAEIQRDQRRK